MKSRQFCPYCGAGLGPHRREGEGTCPKCDDLVREISPEEFEKRLKRPCQHCDHAPHHMEYNYVVLLVRCPFVYPWGRKCICGFKGRPKGVK